MKLLFSLVFALLCLPASAVAAVTDLQVDYQSTPLLIESDTPLFSWRMETGRGERAQQAYALEVIDQAGEILWHSGKVSDTRSVAIPYAGSPLSATSHYRWTVTVWDDSGKSSSAESWFETGFMTPGDQAFPGAKWIGGSARDLVLWSDYLSVFRLDYEVQLDQASASERAAFVFGGNEFRLISPHLNLQGLTAGNNESFIALELDISELDDESGQARLNIYRVGYDERDQRTTPFTRLDIPRTLINTDNRYQGHSVHLEAVSGLVHIYINGRDPHHRITPFDDQLPSYMPQGLNLNPRGAGNNYISYPMLADIGFWLQPGQHARFANIRISNHRSPANPLFVAGNAQIEGYDEIFMRDGQRRIRQRSDGSYLAGDTHETLVLADPSRVGTPMLRTGFTLADKPIARARLYATARGIYELHLNGKRVGDDYFAPGLTQYNRHHPYQAYDVTGQLRQGSDNALGAVLAEGWWSGHITYTPDNWNYFGDRQSLLARLVVTYADGSVQAINTDPAHWKVFHGGPVRYGSFFQGEVYDAGLETAVAGWAAPGFDDSDWQPAQEVPLEGSAFIANSPAGDNRELVTGYDDMDLIGHQGVNPQVVKVLTAQAMDEVRPGVFVYDMGQNMVGVPRITLDSATPGQPVVLRYAEMRYPDLPEHEGLAGMMMIENLRAALTHDIYIPDDSNGVIRPRFTFHGYRYVEISGIDEPPPLDAVQGLVISSVPAITAHYETSNPLVNQLWSNITWSMRGNFLSIPTDTPARNERMGWSGDLNVFARTASYMADINPFIERHLLAMRDLQSGAGRFPDVAPVGGGFGGTLWGSAGIIVPWEIYRQYGDTGLLREHYPAMKHYMNYLQTRIDADTGVLLEGPLGDWLSPEGGRNDNTLLWEAYHVHLLDLMAGIADLLGHREDAAAFRAFHGERKGFFNRTYVDIATGKTITSGIITGLMLPAHLQGKYDSEQQGKVVDTQASYAIPLAMAVFDEANRTRAQAHLANAVIRENTDDSGTVRPPHSLMTGFIGTASLPDALSEAGRDDLVYRLLQQTSYPSWLYPVINGATTIWERLNSYTVEEGFGGNNSMNSFNHYAFGAIGGWMMSHSLGIQRHPDQPGFQQFVLAPVPDATGKMEWARGHYDSPYGRIESEWRIEGVATHYRFVVPENTVATLRLAAPDVDTIQAHPTLKPEDFGGGRAVYRLTPGEYRFEVKR